MRSRRTRSLLVSAFVLVLAGTGWFYLAPTQIGGSTTYVVTHGISMEPRIHTGDLVLVRPESNYRVGQVVAYHSTLLHTVVLHRIIRIEDGHYLFKGDNNSFIDPTHPTRALLIGRMWLHIAGGGVVLDWLHRPWLVAVLLGAVAAFLLFGGEQRRRRRDRGRRGGANRTRRAPPVTSFSTPSGGTVSSRQLLNASLVGFVVFAILTAVAWVRPTATTTVTDHSYSQQVKFGYHALVTPGPVYPDGVVRTGDPLYIQLVHRMTLTATYRFTATAAEQLRGTIRIRGTLANATGWQRGFWLGPGTQFVGDHARATATISLGRLQSLADRVTAQIGTGGEYTLAVAPRVKVAGRIAGEPLSATYSPSLNLTLGASQFASSTSAISPPSGSASTSAQAGLNQSATGKLLSTRTAAATLAGVSVKTIRRIALAGLALFALLAYALLPGSGNVRPPDPAERIRRRYKHLIVPVESVTPSPDHPPIDVSSIDALARLAERSERLILYDHQDDVDNYLIDDEGTLFRFRAPRESSPASVNGASAGVADETPSADVNGTPYADVNGTPYADVNGTPSVEVNGTHSGGVSGLADRGVNGAPAGPDSADGQGQPAPAQPTRGDPSADAAAAILSSAAATLSAAAAQATAIPSPAGGTAGTPEPSGPAPDTGPTSAPDAGPTSVAEGPAATGAAAPGADAPDPRPTAQAQSATASSATTQAQRTSAPAASAAVAGRPSPDLLVVGAQARRPPIPAGPRWTSRREVRAGFAIGPLALCFLAWRRFRIRRSRLRGDDHEEQRSARRSWTTRNLRRP